MKTLEQDFNNLNYGNTITCINSDNLELIERGINNIFKQEGFRRISKPPLPQNPKPLLREVTLRSSLDQAFTNFK